MNQKTPKLSADDIAKIVNWVPSEDTTLARLNAPLNWYFDPQFIGGEYVPTDRGVLFVCNHSVLSVADFAAMRGAMEFSGKPVRGLADRMHFGVPLWGDFLKRSGAVLGDPQICTALMEAGQSILVFPGGGREVMKKRSEKYKLVWKERFGFVRLAMKHNYDIVPIATVGGDEIFEFLADSDDYLKSPLGQMLNKWGVFDKYMRGKDEIPPLIRGVGLSMLPKPHRLYVSFGKPISVADYAKTGTSEESLRAARDAVAQAIEALIVQGIKARDSDPEPTPYWRRLLQSL